MRQSKIQYNPSLSVKENAQKNGVSEAGIRYYIKTRDIDRRYEARLNVLDKINQYLKKNSEASIADVAKETGLGATTVRRYWQIAHGQDAIEKFKSDRKKSIKKGVRELNDFYATHPSCVMDILREEDFNHEILEPFCGIGTVSEVLKNAGYDVESYDIIDRGYGKVGDFFSVDFGTGKYDIITNPPYSSNLAAIVTRCIEFCHTKVALLMPLRYLSGETRYNEIYKALPPARVYVYQERINIAKNADFDTYNDAGANMEIYAWYIWERGYKGKTELKWISNKRKQRGVTSGKKSPNQALKKEIDSMLEEEKRNTKALESNPLYYPVPTKQSLNERLQLRYDTSKYVCVAFRANDDYWKEWPVPFSNMNSKFNVEINGTLFPSSEHAYMCGMFSGNNKKHKDLQNRILNTPSSYMAKKTIRAKNGLYKRLDWYSFRIEWMLFCVWEKTQQNPEFRQMLMALPEGATLIEDASFRKKPDTYWGSVNPDRKKFMSLVSKYVRTCDIESKAAKKRAENNYKWQFCNYGIFEGNNELGRILTYIKDCLHRGVDAEIDYALLNKKKIYLLGKRLILKD